MNICAHHGLVSRLFPHSNTLIRVCRTCIRAVFLLCIAASIALVTEVQAAQPETKRPVKHGKAAKTHDAVSGKKNMRAKKIRRVYVRSLMPVEQKHELRARGISSGVGPRAVSKNGKIVRHHTGIDIPAPSGSPILAYNDGEVIFKGLHKGYGLCVVIRQEDGREARYAHMSKTSMQQGAMVKRGQQVGEVGRTGRATGAHLHFELVEDDEYLDPAMYIWHGSELVIGPTDINPYETSDYEAVATGKTDFGSSVSRFAH